MYSINYPKKVLEEYQGGLVINENVNICWIPHECLEDTIIEVGKMHANSMDTEVKMLFHDDRNSITFEPDPNGKKLPPPEHVCQET